MNGSELRGRCAVCGASVPSLLMPFHDAWHEDSHEHEHRVAPPSAPTADR